MAITSGVQPAAPRPAPKKPQVSRRSFLRTAWLSVLGAATAGFGAGTIYFLWPAPSAGFGAKIKIGTKSDVDAKIEANKDYAYFPDGRFYVVPYSGNGANSIYKPINASVGYLALYQKCVHLGCRVPWCSTSRWWECNCHGSKYNQAGEYKEGPAPRGLDRFKIVQDGDQFTVDTSTVVVGPPRGTDTTGQGLEGPHCVGGGAEGK